MPKGNPHPKPGPGRPSKAEEDRIRGFCIKALSTAFGGEQEAWDHVASMARESFPHMKLLFEYTYGKPKESVSVSLEENFVNLTKKIIGAKP